MEQEQPPSTAKQIFDATAGYLQKNLAPLAASVAALEAQLADTTPDRSSLHEVLLGLQLVSQRLDALSRRVEQLERQQQQTS